ncbi:MAG TPA: CBS domain-containing protein [Flavisolibacter sp.]|jgi:CBS domain-containing protein|nr:CBS domain-containing protein [Flavisolibacter sp.]
MNTVNQILFRKGNVIISVVTGTPVLDALKLMADNNIGSVVVNNEDGVYQGIVTERDYSRKVILQGKSSSEVTVEDIMLTDLPRLSLYDSIDHCMQLMSNKNIRYLPVFSETELKGIISMSDVVKETILIQQETITHLNEYINQ